MAFLVIFKMLRLGILDGFYSQGNNISLPNITQIYYFQKSAIFGNLIMISLIIGSSFVGLKQIF